MEHVIIIGGGIGGAIAHDLTLRGFRVTLLEKGELLSGSTGRHHGLLHSGARYALHDVETARECMIENQILRRVAPEGLEQNDGLFIAVDEKDMSYHGAFFDACGQADIPTEEIPISLARQMEPELSPTVLAAVKVPDATMDAWRLAMHFFSTAKFNGADTRSYSEVLHTRVQGGRAQGVRVLDHRNQREYTLKGDIIINAARPWAGIVAQQIGIHIPVKPASGVMVSLDARLTNMIINRLQPAGEGDIIIPQRNLSLLGTSVWLTDDPEPLDIPQDHVQNMVTLCSKLLPKVSETPIHAAWSAARPLVVQNPAEEPTKISRNFECMDHESRDGVAGFISVFGGKAPPCAPWPRKPPTLFVQKPVGRFHAGLGKRSCCIGDSIINNSDLYLRSRGVSSVMSARPASRDGTSKRSWIPDQVRNDHRSYARLFDWHCNYKRGLGPMQEVRMTSQIVILFKEHGRYGALPYMVSHRIVS